MRWMARHSHGFTRRLFGYDIRVGGRIADVTADFIVFPADGSHTFCDDLGDMAASVPKPRLKLLRSRKLLEPAK